MNTLHFDSTGGASGDMILAALLDLGVDRSWVEDELNKLGIGRFGLIVEDTTDKGIRGKRLRMELPVSKDTPPAPAHEHSHAPHEHGKGLGHWLRHLAGHSHSHDPGHPHAHAGQPGGHRGLSEIRAILERASLPPPVLARSLAVFGRIAEAEARIHATTPEKIHFHEVGALDSIADIVGCNLCLHRLAVDRISVAPLPIGHGTVRCAHGVLPLPAPATADLLTGFPVISVDEEKETVTPTGAALLTAWRNADGPPSRGAWEKVGHGLGTHALRDRPNLLRAFFYSESVESGHTDDCLVLECNLDDMTPVLMGHLSVQLMEKGALDAFVTPIFMKKQRPAMLLTVLCRPDQRDLMLDLIFRESTTFGIRETRVSRTVLERRFETVETPYGPVRVKVGLWMGQPVTRSPEYANCAELAEKTGAPLKLIYCEAQNKGNPVVT